MLHDDSGEIQVIDFEYSGINFRANDLAALLIETTIDYGQKGYSFVHHPELAWDLNSQ